MSAPVIELCVEGTDGAIAAQEGGADRVELCAGLLEGGLTPSFGVIRVAVEALRIPVHVIIRPRGGDFLYSDTEFSSMLADISALRDSGTAAVVAGCLLPDGRIDAARMRAIVAAAGPLSVTCHRAFDMVTDPDEALETLIECGVARVLTSGLHPTAMEGLAVLKRLQARAGGRIKIMACGGLRPETIGPVRRETGVEELHFSAPGERPSAMTYRNETIGMGGTALEREFVRGFTDVALVRETIAAARA